MDYKRAIAMAKEGKEEGYRFLYESTYQSKYYLALKYMKNEEDAQDIMQEAYLKAFSKLDTLESPEAFPKWLGMIVGNLAKNALQKKSPMLFSEVETGEETLPFEYEIADENTGAQPEISYTRQETQILVRELISALSEEQRICILLYEIEGASIKDIAESLQCSENTVKSRLNYGRKNLRKKAEELQKKGYTLYSVTPLPLLLLLLRREREDLSAEGLLKAAQTQTAEKLLSRPDIGDSLQRGSVTGAAKVTTAAKTTADAAVKGGLLHAAAGKAAVVLIGTIIAGSAIYYGVTQIVQPPKTENPIITGAGETVTEVTAPQSAETEPVVTEPKTKEMTDEDYVNLIAGSPTKEEFAFVLAYGPQEIPEQGFTEKDRAIILCGLLGRRMTAEWKMLPDGEGIPVEFYGMDEAYRKKYSVNDLNRLLQTFTDEQYTQEGYGNGVGGVTVEGDILYCMVPELNYFASAQITSAQYTREEMTIRYTYEHSLYDQGNVRETRANKKAVLRPVADGKFRIVRIEEVGNDAHIPEPEEKKSTPGTGLQAVEAAYQKFLESVKQQPFGDFFDEDYQYNGSVQYFLRDLDGDGTPELILGAACAMNAFMQLDCRVYTCEQTDGEYKVVPVEGKVLASQYRLSGDGIGLVAVDVSRFSGIYSCTLITVEGGCIKRTPLPEADFMMASEEEKVFLEENPAIEWLELIAAD